MPDARCLPADVLSQCYHWHQASGYWHLNIGLVDEFLQIFTRLEVGNLLGRYLYRFTRSRIASDTTVATAKFERAKAA
jgi:hypothetical protein